MSFHRNSSFHPAEQWYSQPLSALPTPSVIIDRAVFIRNSARMLKASRKFGMEFRIHIKTHKTSEGTRIQLDPFVQGDKAGKEESGNEERLRATRLIVSTVEEGWMLVKSGVLRECGVKSVLYSLPPAPNTLQRLDTLRTAMKDEGCTLLLMVDHPAQIAAIDRLPNEDSDLWQAFIKVDAGYHRAGIPVHTRQFEDTVRAVIEGKNTHLYGFYVHAGNSYGATSKDEANAFLDGEIKAVNEASSLAREIINVEEHLRSRYEEISFVLSVGATPTANAAQERSESGKASATVTNADDELELHAGNYALYDLQQFATSMIDQDQIGLFVLSTVCSVYPGRNSEIGEALCDAGGLAMSKDKGPIPGHGLVRSDAKQGLQGWSLGRIAQEHGVLTWTPPSDQTEGDAARLPEYGEKLRILPQHACITLANHPWFFVVDSSLEHGTEWEDWSVRDVWTPAKFW